MSISRRRLLGALGVGATTSVAGCNGSVLAGSGGGASAPEGSIDESMANTIFAPGQVVNVDHRRVMIRDVAALREDGSSDVATELANWPMGRVEGAFDQDPATLETYAVYGQTELFTGSFTSESLLESFRSDDWTVVETHHGVDVVRPPDQDSRYAAGVTDGFFLITERHREVPPVEFVRAHAEALAGEIPRYGDDAAMSELLSVVGGGEYVAAITSPVDVGYRVSNTLGVGRAIEVTGDGVVDTFAFVIDESASESPQAYAEQYANQWAEEVAGDGASATVPGSSGRVGYFSTVRPESAYTGGSSVGAAIAEGGPTQPMQNRIDERYAQEHGQEPPDATFTFSPRPDASDVACGGGSAVVAITYESGPPIPVRRLAVGTMNSQEFYRLSNCDFTDGDHIEAGQTVLIGFENSPDDRLIVVWNGPHGNRSVLRAQRN